MASTCVLHGDVERRGGLVGDQDVGAGDQHHGDHDALAHAAGDLVRIDACRRARDRGSARPRSISSAARAAPPLAAAQMACGASRRSAGRRVITGSSEYFGSCSTMAMRLPRRRAEAASRRGRAGRCRRGASRRPRRGPERRIRPMMARPVVDLPEPDLADDAEPLAAEGEATRCAPRRKSPSSPG